MDATKDVRVLKSFEVAPLVIDVEEQPRSRLIVVWEKDAERETGPALVLCPEHASELAKALSDAADAALHFDRGERKGTGLFPFKRNAGQGT